MQRKRRFSFDVMFRVYEVQVVNVRSMDVDVYNIGAKRKVRVSGDVRN